ncbi:MAG: hypothetical protein HYT13_00160 [Candidatus Liptonbacteria bacterium]|nr:hypothetical protein [Candidatus Liptonbacteria bacterium]
MEKKFKKILLFLVIGVLFIGLAPKLAHANIIEDIAYTVIGKIVFGITYIISYIVGLGVAVEAWAIGVILNMNTHIATSPPVRIGFQIALSIANLGFVVAIIVIAIATILRSQTHGIKKLLWKLIVAALLVNFSMVIAGAILNFSDQLTFFLLDRVSPAGTSGFSSFASAIAGAFNPQKGLVAINQINSDDTNKLQGIAALGADIGKLLTPITSLVFVVLSLIVIVITLLAVIVMLIIRYIFIGILLILMPFVWLLWIFPKFSHNWDKWWSNFLRWAFFAPLVLFFLYLGIQASRNMGEILGGPELATYQAGNSTWDSIVSALTGVLAPIVQDVLEQLIIVGIMIGGLFAANKLGMTGAAVAMGAATGAAKALGGWAGRKGGGAAARFATHGPKPAPERPSPEAKGFKAGLQKLTYPFRKAAHTVGAPLRTAAQATSKTLMPKEVFKDISAFGTAAKTSPGILGSVYEGAKKGFKKKTTKLTKAQAKAVGLEIEGEGGAPTPTPTPAPTPPPTPSTP